MQVRTPDGCSGPIPKQRGRWAYIMGSRITDNPYPLSSAESIAWTDSLFQEQHDLEEAVAALCHQRGRGE